MINIATYHFKICYDKKGLPYYSTWNNYNDLIEVVLLNHIWLIEVDWNSLWFLNITIKYSVFIYTRKKRCFINDPFQTVIKRTIISNSNPLAIAHLEYLHDHYKVSCFIKRDLTLQVKQSFWHATYKVRYISLIVMLYSWYV